MRNQLLLATTAVASLLVWQQPAAAKQGCGDPATPIHAIQGSTAASPLAGSVRTVEAVVVASFQGTDRLNGFFVQEEDQQADRDPATSEGLFVYAPRSRAVAVGDLVRVSGTIKEYRSRTELSDLRQLTVCGRTRLPKATRLTLPIDDLERLEGMRVDVAAPLAVTSAREFTRKGHLLVAPERLFQPTQLHPPGAAARALAAANAAQRLLLDDGSRRSMAHPTVYPPAGLPDGGLPRAGDRVSELEGVIDESSGHYRLQPTAPPRFDRRTPRPAPPRAAADQLRVVAFNLHNYFNGDGAGGGFPTPRGAADEEEFAQQRASIAHTLSTLRPDLVAAAELENDGYGPRSAIADLATALTDASKIQYRYVDFGRDRLGDDAITNGLLYRVDRVRPVAAAAALHSGVDRRFSDRNRPALAQTFEQIGNGERFTLVANHFKSKGSSCAASGDPDRGDGQGNCNITRARAAKALAAWLARDPTASRDPDRLIVGDLNAYALEDPIRTLVDAGYVNLIDRHLGDRAYTYIFDGEAGYLDHAFGSPSLASQVARVFIWHINADEPDAPHRQAQPAVEALPHRSSDHDPVIIDLTLGRR